MPEVHGIEQVQHFLKYKPCPALENQVIAADVLVAWLHLAADNHPETGFSIVDSLRLEDFIMRHAQEPGRAPLSVWHRVSRRLGFPTKQG